ncbi:LysE family translocator [Candidatus Pelagibacter sp. HIMB1483]|jgi:threonine/homoserine/homoserine lactone efflux protein|uniref:LysE family translocator n=1 Tax=Candidatus Pelagibacter sp. HIMB1483 TaxID=3415414 RepID=UPI003F841366|tara:strand:+ start:913 stop:1503 length:591 start_codon:yes stop_codon:yes gene_type:complete
MHPEILSISLFWFVTAYTPGPNNVVASYSGFNFGIKKTIPHILGVTLGFTSLVIFLSIGLINVFKLFPIIQTVIRYLGTLFLIYLAYKIAFSTISNETQKENPVKFIETFLFQYLNPKGVTVAIIVVSTYVELGVNYFSYATQIVVLAFLFSITSITLWTFVGKFLRKFATNDKFIKFFNYVMSVLLLLSIITFYI